MTGSKPSEEASQARKNLPRLIKRMGDLGFDLDLDTPRIERLNVIFEQLPDHQVIELADSLHRGQGVNEAGTTDFVKEFGISPAENLLLESLVHGFTIVEHAKNNGVSINTARTHMRRLLEKTDSRGLLDVIRKFYGRYS